MDTLHEIRIPIQHDFEAFEKVMVQSMHSNDKLLDQTLDYILAKPGKRLRPTLVLLAAALCKGVTDKTLRTAALLEMMHTASLVHDDVVDDSPLRHGSAAIQIKWSNKVAVLVGDFILSRAMGLLSEVRNNTIMASVAQLGEQLSSGELLQLHHGQSMWISEKQYMQVIERKTACLFACCGECGAISCGAPARQITALRQFGYHLGLCFQIKDDILDYSDAEELGKPTMHDIRDGKATLPLLKSLERASKQEAEHIRQLCEDLVGMKEEDSFESEQEIKSFVLKYDGVRYAYQLMETHRKKAIEVLNFFPDSKIKSSLQTLLDYSIHRVF